MSFQPLAIFQNIIVKTQIRLKKKYFKLAEVTVKSTNPTRYTIPLDSILYVTALHYSGNNGSCNNEILR